MRQLVHKQQEPSVTFLNRNWKFLRFWFKIYTFAVWCGLIIDFFTNSLTFVNGLIGFYLAFLSLYNVNKEIDRWSINLHSWRLGEVWVGVWLMTYLIIGYIFMMNPETFADGKSALNQIGVVTTGVLANFIGSETSKRIYKVRRSRRNPRKIIRII